MKREEALVVFGDELPPQWRHFDTVVASKKLQAELEAHGCDFVDLGTLCGPGSIYEASALLEELSYMKMPGGTRIAKSFVYKGFELWWVHYENLFRYFCLPFTQYKKLLEYLKNFRSVSVYRPPHKNLFFCYLEAHGKKMTMLEEPGFKGPSFLPFGVLLQIVITLLSLPVLALQRRRTMVYTGDKFEKDKDYDFRMRFAYEELRKRGMPFVEFIRGIEPWRNVLQHAFVRRRPVVYAGGMVFVAHLFSILSGGRTRTRRQFGAHRFAAMTDADARFKSLVATQYLLDVHEDVWAIRIMQWILRVAGVKVAFIPAASPRSYHAVLGCKLNAIPTVGIMHGVQSRFYNVYDFMPGFDGEKTLSVDAFGVWSEWWRAYYTQFSNAYAPGQLHVSGPMRPLIKSATTAPAGALAPLRALFVSEEVAVPHEVLPYLEELLGQTHITLSLKFRPSRDGFEQWLLHNRPDILTRSNLTVLRGSMQTAVAGADVLVGCYSTGVLEALLQMKVPVYFRTKKWGDYYDLKDYDAAHTFFAEDPRELVEKIKNARSVPAPVLKDLQERYFGDPYQNGSAWVVDRLEEMLKG
ncbi:MAG: hypothetical protein AAB919_00610 [Patescibacteria group bacterium]